MSFLNYPVQTLLVNDPSYCKLLWYLTLDGRQNLLETDDQYNLTLRTLVAEGASYSPDPDGVLSDPDGGGSATAVAITDVDLLRITGYADFPKGMVVRAIKSRGVAEQIQISTLSWTLTVPDIGAEVNVEIIFNSWDQKADYAIWNADYSLRKVIPLLIAVGETPTSFARKLTQAVSNQGNKEQRQFPLEVKDNGAGVNTLTARDGFTNFFLKITGQQDGTYPQLVNQVATGKVAAVHEITQRNYTGRNNYANLRMLRPETAANTYANAVGTDVVQKAAKGALYTNFKIKLYVQPSHLATLNALQMREFDYDLYLNEATCGAEIAVLTQYFNEVASTKMNYPATTAALAMASEKAGVVFT